MKSTKQIKLLTFFGVWLLLAVFSFEAATGQKSLSSRSVTGSEIFLPLITSDVFPNWVWRAESKINLDPVPRNQPKLVIDHAGRPHIFWDTLAAGQRFIYHTYLSDTGWSEKTVVANSIGDSQLQLPPIVSPDGTIHLLWHNYLGAGVTERYRLLYASFDGTAWSLDEEVFKAAYDLRGSLQQDEQGLLHVISRSAIFGSSIYFHSRTPSGWQIVSGINPGHSSIWVWPAINGGVAIYGVNYFPAESMLYSFWRNGQFETQNQSLTLALNGRETLLDNGINLHLFDWEQVPVAGGTVYGVTHQCLDNSLSWDAKSVPSGSTAVVSSGPRAAVDRSGLFALGWESSPGNIFQFNLWQGCAPIPTPGMVRAPLSANLDLHAIAISSQPKVLCMFFLQFTGSGYSLICADF